MITILMGRSASGKTTLKEIADKEFKFSAVKNYTTRTPRENEDDYIYLSKKEFILKLEAGEMSEHTIYNGNYYGFGLFDEDKDYLIVAEPLGVTQLMKWGFDNGVLTNAVLLMRDEESRLSDMGDDEARKERDDQYIDYLGFKLMTASISTNGTIEESTEQLKQIINTSLDMQKRLEEKQKEREGK